MIDLPGPNCFQKLASNATCLTYVSWAPECQCWNFLLAIACNVDQISEEHTEENECQETTQCGGIITDTEKQYKRRLDEYAPSFERAAKNGCPRAARAAFNALPKAQQFSVEEFLMAGLTNVKTLVLSPEGLEESDANYRYMTKQENEDAHASERSAFAHRTSRH